MGTVDKDAEPDFQAGQEKKLSFEVGYALLVVMQ